MNQYIIDEEQIDRFCGCISSIEAEKIIDEIRSVPYNPQSACNDCEYLLCSGNLDCCPKTTDRCNPYNPQAEREKVLNEVISNLKDEEKRGYFSTDGMCEKRRIIKKLKELHQQGKQEKRG